MAEDVKARARRAYERGRLSRALRFVPCGLVVGLSWSLFLRWELSVALALPFTALGVWALARGGSLGAGAWPGALVGLVPAALVAGAGLLGHGAVRACSDCVFYRDPFVPALLGAVVAGACLGLGAPARRRWRRLGATTLFAAAVAAPVCWWPFASVVVGGTVLGAALVAVPMTLSARLQRS